MGNFYIRAIETKDDISKVLNGEFTPGLLNISGSKKRVKFSIKKMNRISKKYSTNDIIDVKLGNKFINCKINNISIDEITGFVSWIELEKTKKTNLIKKKIPLVFKNSYMNEKDLKILLTEIDITGKKEDIPEFITIDLGKLNKSEFKISNLNIDKNLKIINKKDDTIALIRSRSPYYFVS
jgi:hypothetical protein